MKAATGARLPEHQDEAVLSLQGRVLLRRCVPGWRAHHKGSCVAAEGGKKPKRELSEQQHHVAKIMTRSTGNDAPAKMVEALRFMNSGKFEQAITCYREAA